MAITDRKLLLGVQETQPWRAGAARVRFAAWVQTLASRASCSRSPAGSYGTQRSALAAGSVPVPAVPREAGGVAAGGAGGRNLGWERGKAAKGVEELGRTL